MMPDNVPQINSHSFLLEVKKLQKLIAHKIKNNKANCVGRLKTI
ncbi:MAG: hypothetical protein ABIH18_06995 [Candidatus Omnitrophota bacterium]